MKKALILAMLLFLLPCCAHAEYRVDAAGSILACREDRPGCHVLQTVMMGSFAQFDPENNLDVRVFSAALPRLTSVTEEDIFHFSECFDVKIETVRELYFLALGNCLLSDIAAVPVAENIDAQNARIVLRLFLDPAGENAAAQMQAIRENCTEKDALLLAEKAQVPIDFVKYLLWKM